jgi:hypothetical protein
VLLTAVLSGEVGVQKVGGVMKMPLTLIRISRFVHVSPCFAGGSVEELLKSPAVMEALQVCVSRILPLLRPCDLIICLFTVYFLDLCCNVVCMPNDEKPAFSPTFREEGSALTWQVLFPCMTTKPYA